MRPLAIASFVGAAVPAMAGPADYVQVPYFDEGHWVLTTAIGRTGSRDGSSETALAPSIGFSPTSKWFTALYAEWTRASGEATRLEAWEWVNQFQLVPASASMPVDINLLLEVERPSERSEGYELSIGPMLQFDVGSWQNNLNLLLSKAVRGQASEPATLGYQWQAKTLWRPGVEFGAQGLGSWGAIEGHADSSQRSHQWGPAVFAHWALGNGRSLKLDAAWLAGLTNPSPRSTLRFQARCDF